MSSSFFGLHIALKGLQAQQKGMEVTGHNIANANSKGYSRQQAVLVPGDSIEVSGLRLGTGVDVATVRRMRDDFLDAQTRSTGTQLGYWEAKQDMLRQVEVVYMEPSANGLSNLMTRFWDSWQELSKNPESSAVRVSLVQNATALAGGINKVHADLVSVIEDIDASLEMTVTDINTKTSQIAQLNEQIRSSQSAQQAPNDLLDKRTLLINELSEMVDIQVQVTENGMVDIYVGGRALVSGINFQKLAVDKTGTGMEIKWDGAPTQTFTASGGKLKGLLDVRTEIKDSYLANLDTLAETLITAVNNLHQAGYDLTSDVDNTGNDFFEPLPSPVPSDYSAAASIKVSGKIAGNPSKIAAASSADSPGDGSVALDIAQLKQAAVLSGGTATFDDFYTDSISRLGVNTREANRMVENIDAMKQQIERRQEAVAGVSLDEEMTNLMQYQHAFAAAARVISTIDEMLEVLINRMG